MHGDGRPYSISNLDGNSDGVTWLEQMKNSMATEEQSKLEWPIRDKRRNLVTSDEI